MITSSGSLLRLELHSSLRATNLSSCFAAFTLVAHLAEPFQQSQPSLLPLPFIQVLHALSTPLILLAALIGIIVVCTIVMVADFHVKKAKYKKWKALPPSGLSTPTKVRTNSTTQTISISGMFEPEARPGASALLFSVHHLRLCPSGSGLLLD